jgi:sporulation protein YlmC with PRC-barrel domain
MLLLGCLFVAPSAVNWRGILTEAAVPSPQQSSLDCEKEEPKMDLAPGTIANPKGVEIGEVKDFVLDLGTGRIAYTVGVFNQIGQSSDRVFVLPWEIVKVDLAMNTFTLSEDKTVLENAPSFALETWPNVPTSQWAGIVTAYWQEKLGNNFAAATTLGQALSKASDLVGTTIKDPAGGDLGTIEELLLDPETGAIAYAVLSSQDREDSNRTVFLALPWDIVQVNPAQHTFRVDINEAMLVGSRQASH